MLSGIVEESDRREGKVRCCWLGDRIISIPCRTRDLALGYIEENDEEKNGHYTEWMLQKNECFSGSHHTNSPPSRNGCYSKTVLEIILAAM